MRSNSGTRQAEPASVSTASHTAGGTTALWIAWSFHRRTQGLCEAFELPLYIVQSRFTGPLRWIELALKTLRLLVKARPGTLFVQNPSLALTTLVLTCRPVFGYFLVVDAHNEGVRPFDRPYGFVRWLTRRILRSANLTIVTNDALAKDVSDAGGRSITLPDRLPVIPDTGPDTPPRYTTPDVAVVATFRKDEPIDAIMTAASNMPDVRFAMSGPAAQYRGAHDSIPANVELTGFLPEPEYWRLLDESAVVCDLTLKPDCLVCGAYEALAAEKPMVLSDNPATRDIFAPAAVLTGSKPAEIESAIRRALSDRERLEAGAQALKESFRQRWQKEADSAWNTIIKASGAAI